MFSDLLTRPRPLFFFFFFNDTATTEIYTLSLHDALPISRVWRRPSGGSKTESHHPRRFVGESFQDRKSTRLNSSHSQISYAVFCLKKKKQPRILSSLCFLGHSDQQTIYTR